MHTLAPRVACFEFDLPTPEALESMKSIKRVHSGVPILMLTESHSEELAVWSFRSRVWNYLVKPVPPEELAENLRALAEIVASSAPMRRLRELRVDRAPQPPIVGRRPAAGSLIRPALRRVEADFAERLRASDLARSCGMSVFQFSRAFHAECGMPFREYLVRSRIAEACRLLQGRDVSITGTCYAVGFNDASHFARSFRSHVGVTPSEYAQGNRPFLPEKLLSRADPQPMRAAGP